MDDILKSFVRQKVKNAVEQGLFDSILFVPINKATIYQRFHSDIRESVAQSSFYRLLSDRRLLLFTNPVEASAVFKSMVEKINQLEDLSVYDSHLIKITMESFNEYFADKK